MKRFEVTMRMMGVAAVAALAALAPTNGMAMTLDFNDDLGLDSGGDDLFDWGGGFELNVTLYGSIGKDGQGNDRLTYGAYDAGKYAVAPGDGRVEVLGEWDGFGYRDTAVSVQRQVTAFDENGTVSSRSGLEPDWAWVRYFDSVTNTGDETAYVTLRYDWNMGTNDDNHLYTDTSGYPDDKKAEATRADRWVITGDDRRNNGKAAKDPVFGLVFGDGTGLMPSAIEAREDDDTMYVEYTFALDAGATAGVVLFGTARGENTSSYSQPVSMVEYDQVYKDVVSMLGAPDFLGLDGAQRQSVLNWTAPVVTPVGGTGVVPEPATVSLLAVGLIGMAISRRIRRM